MINIDDFKGQHGLRIDGFVDHEDETEISIEQRNSDNQMDCFRACVNKAEAIRIREHLRILFELDK